MLYYYIVARGTDLLADKKYKKDKNAFVYVC